MQKLVSLLGIAATLFFAGNSNVSAQAWSQLSQDQKNTRILQVASGDLGLTFPALNCKLWIQQRVVPFASGGAAVIPSTASEGWYWNYSPSVQRVYGQPVPGNIMQMRLKSGTLHTTIVGGVFSDGLYFIDCNWYYQSAPGRVYCHFVTWPQFYSMVDLYTVYSIK
jgi:hypothetical protein